MPLDDKLRQYLLADTSGKQFPTGRTPTIREYCGEVLQGIKLWPAQKLVIKVVINAMDLFPKVPLTEWERATLEQWMRNAEEPFGDKKYAQAIVRKNPKSRSPLVVMLIMGRGSSKTFMSGLLISYFIRCLVSLMDPHKFFGLAKIKPIAFQCLAGKENQAISLFRPIKAFVKNCADLRGTYDELKESLNFGGVIEARAYTSNANTVRGEDSFCYYHEETAFCNEDTPDNEKSFTQCYEAIRPAVKNRFGQYGVMLFATSAGLKRGKTYELYRQIQNGKIRNCVMFQLAIWNINPNFTKEDFAQEYEEDALTADAEHGSQFMDAVNTFLTEREVYSCVTKGQGRTERGKPDIEYWIRLDPSRIHDRYAIAVGHKEVVVDEDGTKRIHAIVDYVKYWESRWELPDGTVYHPKTTRDRMMGKKIGVDIQEVMDHIEHLMERFNVVGVSSDQFESQFIIEELNAQHGTKDFDFGFIKPITEKANWLAYRNLKKMINHGTFHIYDEKAFIEEALVAMRYNKNKPMETVTFSDGDDDEDDDAIAEVGLIFTVQAPRRGKVKTDDVLDVCAFLLWDMMSNPDMTPYDMGKVVAGHTDLVEKIAKVSDNEKAAEPIALADQIPMDW